MSDPLENARNVDGLEHLVAQRTQELQDLANSLSLANNKLKQRFVVTVKMFSGLLELRGAAMAGHSRRVAELSRRLANFMGLDKKEQNDVYLAGLLHDIGKIGLSDVVLNRPVSKLNGFDKAEYCKHAADGAAFLLPLDELKDVAPLVRSHHERYDGHGFPDGLIGDEIPLTARILSVANDYDGLQIGTLSEKRLRPEEARAMLIQAKGKLYDPKVVDSLFILLGQKDPHAPKERMLRASDLEPGMVLVQDLLAANGVLLLAADYTLDRADVRHLTDYERRQGSPLTLHVRG